MSIKQSITVQDICVLLNEMLVLDYSCVHSLVMHRVICNEEIEDHETIQVQQHKNDEHCKVGMIGILNGVFGIEKGRCPICYEIEDGRILKFKQSQNK